jgi:hypothetical protein
MKRALAIFALSTIIIFGYGTAEGTDWKLFDKTDDATYYYAREKIRSPGKNPVEVWVRVVYAGSGQRDYAVGLAEIDCAKRLYSKIQYKVYNKRGTIMRSKGLDANTLRLRIPSGSPVERLFLEVCSE